MVLCLGELGTTDYHSVYILVSDSFAYRSPLKNSFARVKREKFQEKIVLYFDTEFEAKKNIRILTRRFLCFLEMKCGEMFL